MRPSSATGLAANERGHTLVELLTVILIMGILAVVALPIFTGQKDKASDADAKALARTGYAALETYAVHRGDYAATEADVLEIAPELAQASAWVLTTADDEYTVAVDSASGRMFEIQRLADGTVSRTCGPDGGGCPTGGVW